jgi:hypothetical protein
MVTPPYFFTRGRLRAHHRTTVPPGQQESWDTVPTFLLTSADFDFTLSLSRKPGRTLPTGLAPRSRRPARPGPPPRTLTVEYRCPPAHPCRRSGYRPARPVLIHAAPGAILILKSHFPGNIAPAPAPIDIDLENPFSGEYRPAPHPAGGRGRAGTPARSSPGCNVVSTSIAWYTGARLDVTPSGRPIRPLPGRMGVWLVPPRGFEPLLPA